MKGAVSSLVVLALLSPCLSSEAAMLIAGSTDGIIRDIDTSVPSQSVRFTLEGSFGATGLAVDPPNNRLYASGNGFEWGSVQVFDLTTGLEQDPGREAFHGGYEEAYGLEFVDGRLFSLGTQGGKAYLLEYDLDAEGFPVSISAAYQIQEDGDAPALMSGLAYVPERGRFYANQANNFFWELNLDLKIGAFMARRLFGLALSGTNGLGYQDGTLYGLSAGHPASLVSFDLDDAPHQIQVANNAQVSNGWALTGAGEAVPTVGLRFLDIRRVDGGVQVVWQTPAATGTMESVDSSPRMITPAWELLALHEVTGRTNELTDTSVAGAPARFYRVGPPPEPGAIFEDNMESGPGDWIHGGGNDPWEWGAPMSGPGAAHSGTAVWATALAEDYPDLSTGWLRSPVIDLDSIAAAQLEFYDWRAVEESFDFIFLDVVSEDGSAVLTTLVDGGTGAAGWTRRTYSLDAVVGQPVRLEFRLVSDESIGLPGWYIDDVIVTGF